MTLITTLLASSWHWMAAIGGVLVALLVSYFGGKKVGNVQTQAKADVAAAQKDAQQVEASAAQRVQTSKAVNNVHQNVNGLSADNVDKQLRDKWTKD